MIIFQSGQGAVATHLSGFISFIVALLCVQAKLALVPFDIPEAETEIVGGPLVEYSGVGLALYKLMKNMLLFVLPFFLVILYFGAHFGGMHYLYTLFKYLGVVALITVIRNTNPRVRIDQAIRFFWGPMTLLALVAVGLALIGK
jgi:NADH-quinone oxidoreductase subunit H